ncbi:MAG: glyoxalase [Anaerolineae bacterium]|nr:glyoxalase [Anaerolineae bacterium]
MILKSQTIMYVDDQHRSTEFYKVVLNKEPHLNTPGMTEFELTGGAVLGLMPKAAILRLLGDRLPNPLAPADMLRAEIYLIVDNPVQYHQRALDAGAHNLSDLADRDWGHSVAYCLDLDGHVLAFAMGLSDLL